MRVSCQESEKADTAFVFRSHIGFDMRGISHVFQTHDIHHACSCGDNVVLLHFGIFVVGIGNDAVRKTELESVLIEQSSNTKRRGF